MGVYWFIFGLGILAGAIATPFIIQIFRDMQHHDAIQSKIDAENRKRADIMGKMKQMACCGEWVNIDTPSDDHIIKYKFSKNPQWFHQLDLTAVEEELAHNTWKVDTNRVVSNDMVVLDLWVEQGFPETVLIAPILLRTFSCDRGNWGVGLPNEIHWFEPTPKWFKLDRGNIRRVNVVGTECRDCGLTIPFNTPTHDESFPDIPRSTIFEQLIFPKITDENTLRYTKLWFSDEQAKPFWGIVAWRLKDANPNIIYYAIANFKVTICDTGIWQPHPENYEFIPQVFDRITFNINHTTTRTIDLSLIPLPTVNSPSDSEKDESLNSDTSSDKSNKGFRHSPLNLTLPPADSIKDDGEHIIVAEDKIFGSKESSIRSSSTKPEVEERATAPQLTTTMIGMLGPSRAGKSTLISRYGPPMIIGDGTKSTTLGVQVAVGDYPYDSCRFADFMGFEDTRFPPALTMYNVLNGLVPYWRHFDNIAPVIVLPYNNLEVNEYKRICPELLGSQPLIVVNTFGKIVDTSHIENTLKNQSPDSIIMVLDVLNITNKQKAEIFKNAMVVLLNLPKEFEPKSHPWVTQRLPQMLEDLNQRMTNWLTLEDRDRKPWVEFEELIYPLLPLWPQMDPLTQKFLESPGPVSETFKDYGRWSALSKAATAVMPTFLTDPDAPSSILVNKHSVNAGKLLSELWLTYLPIEFPNLHNGRPRHLMPKDEVDKMRNLIQKITSVYHEYLVPQIVSQFVQDLDKDLRTLSSEWKVSPIITTQMVYDLESKLTSKLPAWALVGGDHAARSFLLAVDASVRHIRQFPDHKECWLMTNPTIFPSADISSGDAVTCTNLPGHYIHVISHGIVKCNTMLSLEVFEYDEHSMSKPFVKARKLPEVFPSGEWIKHGPGVVYKFKLGNNCYHALPNTLNKNFMLTYDGTWYYLTCKPAMHCVRIFPSIPSTVIDSIR